MRAKKSASRSHRGHWAKVRSGRRILGMIQKMPSGVYLWKGTAKFSTKDGGVSESKEHAVNNVLKTVSGTGTPEGFRRQYEVSVEES